MMNIANMNNSWKILIADDDEQIHLMTSLVLQDIQFQGKPVELISAYSAVEAKDILEKDEDIALILMDVVMETEQAGLDLARYIRQELKNQRVRIILRTGQPGSAPEKRIILEYDINDYKEKTELTYQKLYTTVIASLRNYDYIYQLELQRKNLERMLSLNTTLFSSRSLPENIIHSLYNYLSKLVLEVGFPIRALIGLEKHIGDRSVEKTLGDPSFSPKEEESICSRIGNIENAVTENADGTIYILQLQDPVFKRLFLFLEHHDMEDMPDLRLFLILMNNLKISFNNISLQEEILSTQKDIITTLTEFIERRSTETASHVYRVSLYSRLLGRLAELDENSVAILETAAPMHDLGKVGITDDILKNPNKLTPDEYERMKLHTEIGYEILNKSNRKILKAAALISLQHHEHWNGKGYPQGLKEEKIHIMARIVTLVDVFDALRSKRSYKEAWSDQKIKEYVKEKRGVMFDPHLTDLFLEHYSDFKEIAISYPDS